MLTCKSPYQPNKSNIYSFFLHLNPLSPILSNYYSLHSNHHTLISDEPLLCTTIFTIYSRYHSDKLRADDIHRKFWQHWQALFTKVIYAQESRTRALGTIESFLLMTEWHPRALHFPDVDECDENKGWQNPISTLLLTSKRSEPNRRN
jgi:hypothetical protein